jgi:hypothetical protein
MGTRAKDAGEVQHDQQQDQGDSDGDPKHGYPAWCAGGRSAVGAHASVLAGVGVAGRIRQMHLFCRAQTPGLGDGSSLSDGMSILNQYVSIMVATYT